MTGSRRKDKAVWWVSGCAFGVAFLMFFFGDTLIHPFIFAAFPAVLCAVLYGVLGPWLRTTLGRILFALMVVVAALLTITVVNYFWTYSFMFMLAEMTVLFAGVVMWTMLAYLLATMLSGSGWIPYSWFTNRRKQWDRHAEAPPPFRRRATEHEHDSQVDD